MVLAGSAAAADPVPEPDPASEAYFTKFVRPVLESSCTHCHGKDKAEGEVRLDSLEACLLGGEDCRIAFHDFADRPNYHVVLDYLTPVAEAETLSVFARKRDLDQGDLLRAVMKHVFLPG